MARSKRHKDVEFAVNDASGKERIFKTFDEAAGFAVSLAASRGYAVNVDVLCYSKAGARWFGCEDSYREDSDASVTERIAVSADAQGRIA